MGWQNAVSVRALQIIVSSGSTGQGVFVYSGTPAAGNGPVFAVTAPGVANDPFGNSVANVLQVGQNTSGHLQVDQFGELIAYDSAGHQTIFLNPQKQYIGIYSPTLAAGNLIASVSAQAITDTTGNHLLAGVAAYSSSKAAALQSGQIGFYTGTQAAGWTLQSDIVGLGGSGLQLDAVSGSITLNTNTLGGIIAMPASPISGFPISGSASLATVITQLNNVYSMLGAAGVHN